MKKNTFTKKLNWLVVPVLAVASLCRGAYSQWLLIAIFVVWISWVSIPYLITKGKFFLTGFRPRQKAKPLRKPAAFTTVESDDVRDKVIIRNVNCRISSGLQSIYKGATWEWCESSKHVLAIAIHGGVGRIKTANTGEFNFAEVKMDPYARIHFNMLKVQSLEISEGVDEETEIPSPDIIEPVNVKAWFNIVAQKTLHELINEVHSRGYKKLIIDPNGEVFITDDSGQTNKQDQLSNMPPKEHWPELIGCLEEEGLKAQSEEDNISLTWV